MTKYSTAPSNYSGIWRSTYWYPSNDHEGEDISEYYMEAHQRGSKLVLESLPQKGDAYMVLYMTIDDDLATGVWEETTSVEGPFQGAMYSGALQLLIDDDGKVMNGQWVGVGEEDGVRKIYNGRWQLVRAGKNNDHA